MSAVLASLAVVAGLVTLSTPSRIPLVVFQRFDIREVDFEDSTIYPLEEIATDTRQYTDAEPRILYQIGVSQIVKINSNKEN